MRNTINWFDIVVPPEQLHHKFKLFMDWAYVTERDIFTSWAKNLDTKDGATNMAKRFQKEFNPILWEAYLHALLEENKFNVDDSVESVDFFCNKNNRSISIEAVTSGVSRTGQKDADRTHQDVFGENKYDSIYNESLLRISNSISNKMERYNSVYSKDKKTKDSPFLIAVGDYAQNKYGQTSFHSIVSLLFGVKLQKRQNKNTTVIDSHRKIYEKAKHILVKKDNRWIPCPIGLFLDMKYSNISAVIYSCTATLGKLSSLALEHRPLEKTIALIRDNGFMQVRTQRRSGMHMIEDVSDGTFVVHNPLANKKLEKEHFDARGITHIYFDNAKNIIRVEKEGLPPVLRRFACNSITNSDIPNLEKFSLLPIK